MTRKRRLQNLGWKTEKILVVEPHDDYEIGEWLGFWRLVKPNGTRLQGWRMPEHPWPNGFQFNCFDGEAECWELAEHDNEVCPT